MSIGQAIEILKEVKELDDSIYSFNEDYMTALDIAIRMLEDDAVPVPFIIDYLNYGGEDKISTCLKEWEKQNDRKTERFNGTLLFAYGHYKSTEHKESHPTVFRYQGDRWIMLRRVSKEGRECYSERKPRLRSKPHKRMKSSSIN